MVLRCVGSLKLDWWAFVPCVDRPCDGVGGANMAALQWFSSRGTGKPRSPLRVRVKSSSWLHAPKAAVTGSSTFRIKCGDDGFHQDSLDVPQQSSTGDLHRARTKALRVSYSGDNFASMLSVLNKWLFSEVPNSRSCDEFSVQELREPMLNAVHNGTADV